MALGFGALVVLILRVALSGHRVTPDEARRAFAQVGPSHPKVQTSPPGVIFNYGKPPHTVSVSVFSGAAPRVIFLHHSKAMRVTRWDNVMVYYNKSETRAVMQASKTLGDHAWSSSAP